MSAALTLSQRRVCRALGAARSVVRYQVRLLDKDKELVGRMRELARKHPRFGYRRAAALLRGGGYEVNDKRVQRLWRREGLKVPRKVGKKRRLGHDGSGPSRRRAARINEVWSYDFVFDQTAVRNSLRPLIALRYVLHRGAPG